MLDGVRPTAAARGYGAAWRRRSARYLRRHRECVACGARAVAVDHIVPLASGGDDHESNYQALCKGCHTGKTNRERGQR